MSVQLLTENHLEFLGLKGGYTGSSVSTLVKMPHCWKSRVTAQVIYASESWRLCSLVWVARIHTIYETKLGQHFN